MHASESVVTTMEQFQELQNQVAAMRQEISSMISLSVPVFIRNIDDKVKRLETFANNVGDIDKAISDKVNLIEQRLKEQFEAI